MVHSIDGFKLLYNYVAKGEESIPIDILHSVHRAVTENQSPSCKDIGEFLRIAIEKSSGDKFARFIKLIAYKDYLSLLIPELDVLKTVPQDKGRLRVTNALDHTVLVIRYAQNPFETLLAMYHDIGKSKCEGKGYKGHDILSANIAYKSMWKLGFDLALMQRAYYIIANHMTPHDYQRRKKNKWSDERVKKFIADCHGIDNAIATIHLSIADKRASHDVAEFIEPYYELERRCISLSDKAVAQIPNTPLCPNCLPTSIALTFSKATNTYSCKMCGARYFIDDAGRLSMANVVKVVAEVIDVRGEDDATE